MSHWKQAKRLLKYLQGSKSYGLEFSKNDQESLGFVDVDWSNNSVDLKSYTEFSFTLSGSVVLWESRKRKTVALSSMEAEYMVFSEASKEAIYLKT